MQNTSFRFGVEQRFATPAHIISPVSESEQEAHYFPRNLTIAPCPHCGSNRLNVVKMPPHCIHHAALRCSECDAFRAWAPKPANQQKRQQRHAIINQLLQFQELTDWERTFLKSVSGAKKLSPRQEECLAKIEAKLLGGVV